MAASSSVLPPPLLLEKSSDTPSSQSQHDKMEKQQSALHSMTGQRPDSRQPAAACSADVQNSSGGNGGAGERPTGTVADPIRIPHRLAIDDRFDFGFPHVCIKIAGGPPVRPAGTLLGVDDTNPSRRPRRRRRHACASSPFRCLFPDRLCDASCLGHRPMPAPALSPPCDTDPLPSNDDGPAVSTILPASSSAHIRWSPGVSPMSSGSNDADTAPWANFLPELCNVVLDHLDVISIIRFPGVCTDWAAAFKNTHRPRLPPGTPTLLTSSLDPEGYDVEYDVEPGTFGLHDVATGKSYYGEAEGLKKRTWIGGKNDWLVTTDLRCSVELLNPITGVRVPLPSFETIPGVKVVEVRDRGPGVSFEKSPHHYFPKVASWFWMPAHRLQKVMLCQTPAHKSGYLAVALFSSGDSTGLVAFTAVNDKRWTLLKNPKGLQSLGKYTDVTVHKGKVLAVDTSGKICSWVMDVDTPTEPTILPPLDMDIGYSVRRVFYLATSSGGDLQLVCMFGDYEDIKDERWYRIVFDFQWSFWPSRVSLHELDTVTNTWRRVGDLGGGRALFVGANYPFYADVPCNGSRDPLLQADCVYVADLINCDAGIFDLKLQDDFEFNCGARLDYPALSDPLQMPMWFRPTAALPKSTSAHSMEER